MIAIIRPVSKEWEIVPEPPTEENYSQRRTYRWYYGGGLYEVDRETNELKLTSPSQLAWLGDFETEVQVIAKLNQL